jgi:hypothetical protein
MGAGGVSPVSEKEASGEGRIEGDGLGCCATKPPTPWLGRDGGGGAAVEVAEQAHKLRVVGGGDFASVGEGGCQRRGESRMAGGKTAGGGCGGPGCGGGGGREVKADRERRKGRGGRRRRGKWAGPPAGFLHAARHPPAAEGGVQDPPVWYGSSYTPP